MKTSLSWCESSSVMRVSAIIFSWQHTIDSCTVTFPWKNKSCALSQLGDAYYLFRCLRSNIEFLEHGKAFNSDVHYTHMYEHVRYPAACTSLLRENVLCCSSRERFFSTIMHVHMPPMSQDTYWPSSFESSLSTRLTSQACRPTTSIS